MKIVLLIVRFYKTQQHYTLDFMSSNCTHVQFPYALYSTCIYLYVLHYLPVSYYILFKYTPCTFFFKNWTNSSSIY